VNCLNKLSKRDVIFIGFMLFSMLFGAGNLIFPAYLGQAAGENVLQAVIVSNGHYLNYFRSFP
jgi:branched-chain amino acid:cation transporter, LIVCS family